MTAFTIGQRVRTTVDAPAMWPGAFDAPAGTLGTITGPLDGDSAYAVLLDGDPACWPADYQADEITPT